MSIASIVTRGYAFGAIADIVTRGYAVGAAQPGDLAIPAPGPLLLSPKAYRELIRRRRKAEAELERARRAEDDKRRARRDMVARAVRGEAEPAAEDSAQQDAQRAPDARPTAERPATLRKFRKVAPPREARAAPADTVSPRIAALAEIVAGLQAAIAAHEAAQEDDDIEALLLLAA
jgi:hypothetical protein